MQWSYCIRFLHMFSPPISSLFKFLTAFDKIRMHTVNPSSTTSLKNLSMQQVHTNSKSGSNYARLLWSFYMCANLLLYWLLYGNWWDNNDKQQLPLMIVRLRLTKQGTYHLGSSSGFPYSQNSKSLFLNGWLVDFNRPKGLWITKKYNLRLYWF